jgi:REP element-mobilizing transposase RayT
MARPLRIKFEDALYHITARGNEQRKIFLSNADREKFKGYLKDVQERYQFILHAYVLMGTHVHLIGQTPLANLSREAYGAGLVFFFRREGMGDIPLHS